MNALGPSAPAEAADADALIHDFNNVLSRLLGASEQLVENLAGDPANRELASICLEAADRSRLALVQLRTLLEPAAAPHAPVACAMALEAAAAFVRQVARSDVEVHASAEPGIACLCDSAELHRALVVLMLNAVQAMSDGGVVLVDATPGRLPPGAARMVGLPGGFVAITVHHTGPGGGTFDLGSVAEFARKSGGGLSNATPTAAGMTVTLYVPLAS